MSKGTIAKRYCHRVWEIVPAWYPGYLPSGKRARVRIKPQYKRVIRLPF
jgi:hypothetical protein